MSTQANNIYCGPFSTNTFDKAPWIQIKETISNPFWSTIQIQVLVASQQLLQFLQALDSCSDLNQHFGEPSISSFFFEDFLPKTFGAILARTSFENLAIENTLDNCLQYAIFRWEKTLKPGQVHESLTEIAREILNPYQQYYCTPFISFKRRSGKGENGFFNKLVTDLIEHGVFDLIPDLVSDKNSLLSMKAMESIFEIVTRLQIKFPQMEEVSLKMSMKCLESQNIEARILGLSRFSSSIENISASNPSFQQTLIEILKQKDIFNIIYRDVENATRVKYSRYILYYLLDHGLLEDTDFDILIQSLLRAINIDKINIYKEFRILGVSKEKERLIKYIIPQILNSVPADITIGHIELLFFAYSLSDKSQFPVQQIQDFYWAILMDNIGTYKSELYQPTVERFSEIAENRDPLKYISTVIVECIENIKQETSIYASIRLTEYFISLCSSIKSPDGTNPLTMCISFLCDELDLIKIIINGIGSFKSSVRERIGNEAITREAVDALMDGAPLFMTQIEQRIEFIADLVIAGKSDHPLITYDLLLELWKECVRNAFFKAEKDYMFSVMKYLAESDHNFLGSVEELERFFFEEMIHLEFRHDLRDTKQGVLCFKSLFLIINESHNNLIRRKEEEYEFDSEFNIKTHPQKLIEFEVIWDFALFSQDEDAAETVINLLTTIHYSLDKTLEAQGNQIRQEYLDQSFKYLKETVEEKRTSKEEVLVQRCCRCMKIIAALMTESERNGLGDLKTHSQLVKRELMDLIIKSNINAGDLEIECNIILEVYHNTTVFELRTDIAKRFKIWLDEVILTKDEPSLVEIASTENGRTLYDIGIENGTSLVVKKREIPKVGITLEDGSLNPRVIRIYKEWFEDFSDNGKMSPEQACSFLSFIFNEEEYFSGPDGEVAVFIFEHVNYERNVLLSFKGFQDLCGGIREDNPEKMAASIWTGRRNDLKVLSEVIKTVDKCSLSAYMISSKRDHFELLMSLLECENIIASQAWALLRRIPASLKVFTDILSLKGLKDVVDPQNRNWNGLLNINSKYILLYSLEIIEYLLDNSGRDEEGPASLEVKKKWQEEFIRYGGFDHLCGIFQVFNTIELNGNMSPESRRILSFIKTIQNNYSLSDVETLCNNQDQKNSLVEFLKAGSQYIENLYTS